MVNYSNGKIYKIEALNGEDGDIYIGSTTEKLLSRRMNGHRCDYKRWSVGNQSKTSSYDIFQKYGVENCRIVLIESVSAFTKDQLTSREAYYIRTMDCVNKNIPDRSMQEYLQDNMEIIKERKKEYYKANIEKFKNRNKIYRERKNEERLAVAVAPP